VKPVPADFSDFHKNQPVFDRNFNPCSPSSGTVPHGNSSSTSNCAGYIQRTSPETAVQKLERDGLLKIFFYQI
jgi:hypothetical protein